MRRTGQSERVVERSRRAAAARMRVGDNVQHNARDVFRIVSAPPSHLRLPAQQPSLGARACEKTDTLATRRCRLRQAYNIVAPYLRNPSRYKDGVLHGRPVFALQTPVRSCRCLGGRALLPMPLLLRLPQDGHGNMTVYSRSTSRSRAGEVARFAVETAAPSMHRSLSLSPTAFGTLQAPWWNPTLKQECIDSALCRC